jgi:hypothetical protein
MAKSLITMQEIFSQKDNLEEFAIFLLNKVLFIYVSTESTEDAFRLFTILNDRGMPLSHADILKSINIGEVPTEDLYNYSIYWENLEEKHGDKFDRFLSFARTILLKNRQTDNLLDEFEKNIYAKGILRKGKDTIDGSDAREGLSVIISLKVPESLLQFEGQTKGKLGTPQAKTTVESIVYEKLSYFLLENKDTAMSIMDKVLRSKLAREAARKARQEAREGKNKSKQEKNLSGKLAPAQGKNSKINELFLVEGDSAGGSAKGGRDRKFQAILPLRGKVLNTSKASREDVYKNEELNTMISFLLYAIQFN